MESKMVTRKREAAARLRRAAERFIEQVVPALEERFSPYLAKGERPPDFALLALLATRRVDWRLERLIAADAANHAARASLPHLRHRREDLCATLRRSLLVRFEPARFVEELEAPVAALAEVLEEIAGAQGAAALALEGKMRAQAGFELECGVGLKVLAAFSALVAGRKGGR